jgi:serine/threonine protein kinase
MKPGNILITEGSSLKIGDLGSAVDYKNFRGDIEEGDSRYMAPELLNEPKNIGPAADVFSLGATIYEMATGVEMPQSGNIWYLLRSGNSSLSASPNAPRRSPELEELVQQMMRPLPQDRITIDEILCHKTLLTLLKSRIQKLSTSTIQLRRGRSIQGNDNISQTYETYAAVYSSLIGPNNSTNKKIPSEREFDRVSTSDSSFEEIIEDDEDDEEELIFPKKKGFIYPSTERDQVHREQARRESLEPVVGRLDRYLFDEIREDDRMEESDDDEYPLSGPAIPPKNLMKVSNNQM